MRGELSLNPGALSEPRPEVLAAMARFRVSTPGSHVASYQAGRERLGQLRRAAAAAFGGDAEGWAYVRGHTEAIDRLVCSLAELGLREVVTAPEEHEGGIGAFRGHPSFRVEEVAPDRIAEAPGALFFVSHVTYATNRLLGETIRELTSRPDRPVVVVDGCQALGQIPVDVPALGCQAYLASGHKWLGGPPGTGLLHLAPSVRARWPAPCWAGTPLCPELPVGSWEPRGGQDFSAIAGLLAAVQALPDPSDHRNLRDRFARGLVERLGDQVEVLAPRREDEPGRVVVFTLPGRDVYQVYRRLNEHGLYLKCIVRQDLQVLRAGFPWWLHPDRLDPALEVLARVVLG